MKRLTVYYGQWGYGQTKGRFGNIGIFSKHCVRVNAAEKNYCIGVFLPYALDVFCYIRFHSLKNLL